MEENRVVKLFSAICFKEFAGAGKMIAPLLMQVLGAFLIQEALHSVLLTGPGTFNSIFASTDILRRSYINFIIPLLVIVVEEFTSGSFAS